MIFPRETLKTTCSVCSGFGCLLRERRGLSRRGDGGVRVAAARRWQKMEPRCPARGGGAGSGASARPARRLGAGLLGAPVHFLRARPGVLRDGGGRQCPCAPASRISAATKRARARTEGPGPGGGTRFCYAPRSRNRRRGPVSVPRPTECMAMGRARRCPPVPARAPGPARTARGAVGVARAVLSLSHRRRQDFSVLEETRIKHRAEEFESAVTGPRELFTGGCLRRAVGAFSNLEHVFPRENVVLFSIFRKLDICERPKRGHLCL